MNIQIDSLNGQYVRLEALRRDHREGLVRAAQDPRIWAYMPAVVSTEQQVDALIESALAARDTGAEVPSVVIAQESETVLGSTRLLDISHPNRSAEIGWTWLSPSVWRTPVNTECKYLLLSHCFDTAGAIRVQLKTDSRNERSQRAIERIGGVKEGILRRHRILHDGYIRDSVYYSILDTEWPHVKHRLEEMLQRADGER